MSETSILPTQAAPPDPGGGSFGQFEEDGGGDDRRRLLIIAGAVGVVVVLLAAYFLLKGGGGSDDAASGLVPRGTPHAGASAPAVGGDEGGAKGDAGGAKGHGKGKGEAGSVLPRKSHTRLARDPFKPLITAPVVTEPTGDPTKVTGSESGTGGTTTGSGSGTPTEASTPSGPPVAIRLVAVKGHSTAVFDVAYAHNKSARFEVAAPTADSTTGTVFAKTFALLGIQGGEVTLQIGDDTPFDLKVGASHAV